MPFVYPADFLTVWMALVDNIKAQSIFGTGGSIQAKYTYFNTQPELRNSTAKNRFPGIVLITHSPIESPDWQVEEGVKSVVNVIAEAPYLEGAKAPTIALANGQTLEFTRGFLNGSAQDEETITATFLNAQFADINQATPSEIAAVLDILSGISSFVPSGEIVRVIHNDAGSNAYLKVKGGTAINLLSTFPNYEVVGRDAGEQVQSRQPVTHYDFSFQLATLTKRFDNHNILTRFIEALFREGRSPKERSLSLSTAKFEVARSSPVDDSIPTEGVFSTIYPFVLRRIPIAWDADSFGGDNYNGGNYNGTGENPRNQQPVVVDFSFSLDAL